jgi:protoporphyrin/coproporphyrin ferrochelatase
MSGGSGTTGRPLMSANGATTGASAANGAARVPPRLPIGVLLMAYGGPDSLEEVPGYLADIRSGRPTPRAVVEEITEHYRLIGGSSPLRAHSERQRAALAARLDPARFRCYLGMRHWSPWIEEVVPAMAEEGITQAVAVVLAPHYSRMNTERYFQKVEAGCALAGATIEFARVKGYHDSPPLIEALARRVKEGIERWPAREREKVHVVFCAHSLPARVMASGDPYDAQLRETARRVAERSGLPAPRWSWSYMSAGRSPEPWLGPDLSDHLSEIAGRGVHDVVCVPVGFVADHVEVLYDIDIEAQAKAWELGVRLERPPSLNDDPLFIEALAGAVESKARESGFIPDGSQR